MCNTSNSVIIQIDYFNKGFLMQTSLEIVI